MDDFSFERHGDANRWEGIAMICAVRAVKALEAHAPGYTRLQCDQIADIFRSMKATHRTIRRLLDFDGPIDPETVDVLALARLQLECLYAICLMLEDPKYVTHYMQDYWRKKYVKYLLEREETKNLPRLKPHFDFGAARQMLMDLGRQFGVAEAQIMTVESEELGTPMRRV
ncbi:MAG: hypothetical protein ACLP59_00610 [Bryobacteraceae bacterium]